MFEGLRKNNRREDYKAQLAAKIRKEARIKEKLKTLEVIDAECSMRKAQVYREIADIQAGRA